MTKFLWCGAISMFGCDTAPNIQAEPVTRQEQGQSAETVKRVKTADTDVSQLRLLNFVVESSEAHQILPVAEGPFVITGVSHDWGFLILSDTGVCPDYAVMLIDGWQSTYPVVDSTKRTLLPPEWALCGVAYGNSFPYSFQVHGFVPYE